MILSFLSLSSLESQELGKSPLDYKLSENDSLEWPITYQIEVAINDLRNLQVKSENFYTKLEYAYYSKFDSIYITELRDTIPLYPEYDISLIYPESDFTYANMPGYNGKVGVIDSTYYQWTAPFEGILPIKWNLRDYPFDSQKLKIRFYSRSDTSQVLLEESKIVKSNIYKDNINFLVDGYEITGLTVEKKFNNTAWIEEFSSGTRNVVNSELIFNIEINRKGTLYFKLFWSFPFLYYFMSCLLY